MALVGGSEVFVTFKDAKKRSCDWSQRITTASAQAYVAAADETARNATAAGLLMTSAQVLSELTMVKKGVHYQFIENAPTLPAEDSGKLRGNKLTFQIAGSGRGFVNNIPGRNMSVLTLVDGNIVVVDDGGAVDTYRDRFNAIALDINGNPATINGAYIND